MDLTTQRERFIQVMADFTGYAGKHLPDDVIAKLKELRNRKIPPWQN